ncbi:MAG TPA: GntR family transcriptional regulator [Burkholderiales bacterium]|jgi:DNA-binding GntR family transcriptional regulator
MNAPIPLDRATLAHTATTRLRDMIIEGRIAPGARLNERVLTEELQVSRTPLREAFKTLAGEGLVELLPQRGAVVATLDAAMIAATYELMADLEGLSGELAAQRITDGELAEIRALQFDMLASHARRDLPGYFRANMQIHNKINAAARNPVLTETFQRLNLRLYSTRYRSNLTTERWDQAIAEHGEILKLLEARDGPALRALLTRHLLNKRDTILSSLKVQAAAAAA